MLDSLVHKITKLQSCRVEVRNGVLEGHGHFLLRTMTGEKSILLPWRIDEVGPAEVFTNYCSSLVFLEPKIHFYWIIPALLFFLIMLLAPVSYRYLKLKKYLAKYDYKSKFTFSGLKLKGPMGNRKIGMCRLILYCYWLASATVDACITLDRIVGNTSLFAVNLWPGERLCTSNGYIELTSTLMNLPLELEYETGSWTHKRESSWGCSLGSCPNAQECSNMRNSPTEVTRSSFSRSFCDNYPKSCAFGHGCWYGKDTIKFIKNVKLYGFAPDSEIKVNKISGTNCQGVRGPHSSLALSNLRIALMDNDYYLCPSASPRGGPKLGTLGDLQISVGSIRFDWDSVVCDKDWFRTENCKFLKGPSLDKVCMKLPVVSGGVKFFQNHSSIYASLDSSSSLVIGSCSGKFVAKESDCFDIKIKMIGNRESTFGLSLTLRADSKDNKGSTIVRINCTSTVEVHLPCDGTDHFIAISEQSRCIGVSDETKNMPGFNSFETELEHINIIKMMRLHNSDVALFSGFWVGVILLVIMAYTCCCRVH